MAKRAQSRSGEERTHDEFDREDAFGRVFFNFIKPGEDLVWTSRSWKIWSKWWWNGETCILIFSRVENGASEHDRSGKPEEISWDSLERVDPHRKEPLLSRTAHSARYEETIHERMGRLVSVHYLEQVHSEKFVMGSDAAEFVNKVKDQVQNRQKRMSNIAESGDEHSIIWRMFMATTLNAATFVGKNFSTIHSVVKNHENLTLKQMFDVTAQLMNNQEEINCLDKILWEKNSWTRLSLIGDETVINLQSTTVYVFSDSVLCLGKVLQHPKSNEAWKNRVAGVRSERSYRDFDAINGESTEFEWNIFPRFTRCSSVIKSMIYWAIGDKHQQLSREEFQSCQCFQWHLLCQKRQQRWMFGKCGICEGTCEKICYWATVIHSTTFRKEVVFFREQSTRSLGQHCGANVAGICREWTSCFPCNDSIFQESSHEQRTRKNCLYTLLQIKTQLTQFIEFILSVNQLSVYGAVTACPADGSINCSWRSQSRNSFANESPMKDQIIWQQYIQQVESLSPENKVSKFCKEAEKKRAVEVGLYFVTKDTGDFRQFRSVACREYTLLRDDRASQPKGWIQGNMRIGSVLEVTTSFQHFKYGIEIRIESVNQDNSHSWVRISHGTVKYVTESIEDNTEIPADLQEEQVPQTSTCVAAARSKAKTKRENSLGRQEPYQYMIKDGLTLSHQNKILPRSLEESDQSFSTQSNVATRRRWCNWILQDKNSSSKSSFTNT